MRMAREREAALEQASHGRRGTVKLGRRGAPLQVDHLGVVLEHLLVHAACTCHENT